MTATPPTVDLIDGDDIRFCDEVLAPDDLSFDPTRRPEVNSALATLSGVVDGWPVPLAAGTLPHHKDLSEQALYNCLFGRDSLVIGSLVATSHPHYRRDAVVALAFFQGSATDWLSDEEPGRIAHEVRVADDPRAAEISHEAGWRFPYYGSVDATLVWLSALKDIATDDPHILDRVVGGHSLSRRAEWATLWVVGRLDAGGGVIRSTTSNPRGIVNQVWKDSGDSYLTAAGHLASSPGTASVETLGEAYDALHAAAWLARQSSTSWSITPNDLVSVADDIQARLVDKLWCGDYFAMGEGLIGGQATLLDAVASNQWRLLDSAILVSGEVRDYATALVGSVLDPDIAGPRGIRTLAASHPRYRPGGYHTGSTWPHDTTLIVRGLLRHGATKEATELASRTLSAIESVGGYPEFFRSDSYEDSGITRWVIDVWDEQWGQMNRVCQPPQMLQGWSIASYHWLRAIDRD